MNFRVVLFFFFILLTTGCEKLDLSPRNFSGTVTDGSTQKPLNGVIVKIKNRVTKLGLDGIYYDFVDIDQAITDYRGNFRLDDSDGKSNFIYFTREGYHPVTFEIKTRSSFTIELYKKTTLYLSSTMTSSDDLLFSIASAEKVIYNDYEDRVSHTYTRHYQSSIPDSTSIETYAGCNYAITAQYGTSTATADISFKNADEIICRFDFNNGSLSITSLEPSGLVPVISPVLFTEIKCGRITCKWTIEDNEGTENYITSGIIWSKNPGPTIENNSGKVTGTLNGGSFTASISAGACLIYVRPYVRILNKIYYGDEITLPLAADPPEIESLPQINLTRNSAYWFAHITYCNCNPLSDWGYCWSESQNPSVTDNFLSQPQKGCHLTGLTPQKTYYIRPYTNSNAGITYGEEKEFTIPSDSITDIDGNVYDIVKIGAQWWMSENLKTIHFANGEKINKYVDRSIVTDTASFCSYDFDPKYIPDYGLLYNWYAVAETRKLCPAGWHVPTDTEWNTLISYVDQFGADNTVRYRALQEAFALHWLDTKWLQPDSVRNITGFSARGAGGFLIFDDGTKLFCYNLRGAYFWSSSESEGLGSSIVLFGPTDLAMQGNGSLSKEVFRKGSFLSVRCLKD